MTRPLAFPRVVLTAISAVAVPLITVPANAAGSNMPWEQPLQQILQRHHHDLDGRGRYRAFLLPDCPKPPMGREAPSAVPLG